MWTLKVEVFWTYSILAVALCETEWTRLGHKLRIGPNIDLLYLLKSVRIVYLLWEVVLIELVSVTLTKLLLLYCRVKVALDRAFLPYAAHAHIHGSVR